MNDEFYNYLFRKQSVVKGYAPNQVITTWALKIMKLLYPEQCQPTFSSLRSVEEYVSSLRSELAGIIGSGCDHDEQQSEVLSTLFFDRLPDLYEVLNTDIQAIYEGDPAAQSEFEVVRTYPGFYAIYFYRIAHTLSLLGIPLIPRILTEHAHSVTGIDIHPSAVIGEHFYIDHGTGVVIGESCVIGKYVKIYQGVTLGALSVHKNMAGTKRHPTVEDHVIIYSGATILGGDTVIGHHCVIGGNVWLTQSVEPYSTVYHTPMITVQNINRKA